MEAMTHSPTDLMKSLRFRNELEIHPERFRIVEEISQGLRPFAAMSRQTYSTCCHILSDTATLALNPKVPDEDIWTLARLAVQWRILDAIETAETD